LAGKAAYWYSSSKLCDPSPTVGSAHSEWKQADSLYEQWSRHGLIILIHKSGFDHWPVTAEPGYKAPPPESGSPDSRKSSTLLPHQRRASRRLGCRSRHQKRMSSVKLCPIGSREQLDRSQGMDRTSGQPVSGRSRSSRSPGQFRAREHPEYSQLLRL